jgi:hypothetical protein
LFFFFFFFFFLQERETSSIHKSQKSALKSLSFFLSLSVYYMRTNKSYGRDSKTCGDELPKSLVTNHHGEDVFELFTRRERAQLCGLFCEIGGGRFCYKENNNNRIAEQRADIVLTHRGDETERRFRYRGYRFRRFKV